MPAKLKNGVTGARGGKREGSGRKASITKVVLKRVQADHATTAEIMFKLVVQIANDKKAANPVRLQAAIYVCDRVWGRPPQAITLPDGPLMRIIMQPPNTEPPAGVGPKRA